MDDVESTGGSDHPEVPGLVESASPSPSRIVQQCNVLVKGRAEFEEEEEEEDFNNDTSAKTLSRCVLAMLIAAPSFGGMVLASASHPSEPRGAGFPHLQEAAIPPHSPAESALRNTVHHITTTIATVAPSSIGSSRRATSSVAPPPDLSMLGPRSSTPTVGGMGTARTSTLAWRSVLTPIRYTNAYKRKHYQTTRATRPCGTTGRRTRKANIKLVQCHRAEYDFDLYMRTDSAAITTATTDATAYAAPPGVPMSQLNHATCEMLWQTPARASHLGETGWVTRQPGMPGC